MCDKRNLAVGARRTFLLFKALRFAGVVPFAVLNVFVPSLLLLIYLRKGAGEEFSRTARQLFGLLSPFLTCWWAVFVQRFFVEDPGFELLFVGREKSGFSSLLVFFLFGAANSFLAAVPFFFLSAGFFSYWLRLLLVSVFFFGAAYFVSFFTRSVTAAVLFLVIYVLLNIFSFQSVVTFPFYYSPESENAVVRSELPLAVLGLALIGFTRFRARCAKK